MRDHWHLPKRVNSAEAHDIKLELDVRCQKLIEKILRAAFPEISLLGEEGCSGDEHSDYRWVVDPIDGTVNYFFGMPHAAVSIALQKAVEPRELKVEGKKFSALDPRRKNQIERKSCPRQPARTNRRGGSRHGIFQEQRKPGKKFAALDSPCPQRIENPAARFGGVGTRLRRVRSA